MSCSVCNGHNSASCPNCGDGLDVTICPNCKGTGNADWKVFDVIDRRVVTCEEIAYIYAANDEDEADYLGQRFCKLSCECQTCKGQGNVYTNGRNNIFPII